MFDERVKGNLILRLLPRRFSIRVGSITAFLKYNNGFLFILVFLVKTNSCACIVRSGSSEILYWYPKSCIFNKSLLSVEADVFMHFKIKKPNKLTLPKCLASDCKLSDKYFI